MGAVLLSECHYLYIPTDSGKVSAAVEKTQKKRVPQQRTGVREAAMVAADHAEVGGLVIQRLVCDAAPQCTWITAAVALCWVHDRRRDTKRDSAVPQHRPALEPFLPRY